MPVPSYQRSAVHRNRVQRRRQIERENGNVVFLTEALRGFGYLLRSLQGQAGKALETVKLSVWARASGTPSESRTRRSDAASWPRTAA